MISPLPTRRPTPLPAGSRLLQDLGFLAFTLPRVEILMPPKKPRGQELTLEQKMANKPCTVVGSGLSMLTAA